MKTEMRRDYRSKLWLVKVLKRIRRAYQANTFDCHRRQPNQNAKRESNIWVCNTYQSILLMKAWLKDTDKKAMYLIPSRHRKNLRKEALIMLGSSARQVTTLECAINICLVNIRCDGCAEIYLPHTSHHLYTNWIGKIFAKTMKTFVAEDKIQFYDEGLSLLHILAGTKDYPSVEIIKEKRLLCLPHQTYFYQKIDKNLTKTTDWCARGAEYMYKSMINKDKNSGSANKGSCIHLISSRFMNYDCAFMLSDLLKAKTVAQTFYPHPNKDKDPSELPERIKVWEKTASLEEDLTKELTVGDYVITGFTNMVPYLIWLNNVSDLRINIAITMRITCLGMEVESKRLIDLFGDCCKFSTSSLQSERITSDLSDNILIGTFPIMRKKLVEALTKET